MSIRSRQEMNKQTEAAKKKRSDIVATSAALFERHGYHLTSMTNIAEAVGIRKPTLYHYFSTKAEILYWIHEEFIGPLIERQEKRAAENLPAETMIRESILDILNVMKTHWGYVRTFFEHHRELPEPWRGEIEAKRERYRQLLETSIRNAVKEGRIRDLDPVITTLAIFGMTNWSYQWYRADGPLSPEEVADAFSDLVLNGMLTRDSGEGTASTSP